MTRKEQAEEQIGNKVDISNQKVTYAKSYFLKNFNERPENMILQPMETAHGITEDGDYARFDGSTSFAACLGG